MTPVHPHYPLAPAAIVSSAGTTPPAAGLTTPPVVAGHAQSYVDMYPPAHPLATPHEDAFQDVRRFSHDQAGLANGSGVVPSTSGADGTSTSGYDPSPHPLHTYMRPHSPRAGLGASMLSTV
ncbi:hypothetical protein BGW41_008182 [Actinomortierella wolfii]|nr:hypothetical protein BGW41_008182 [Actinomortierella wolfii]